MFVADGVCVQSIEHPGCVWDAKFLENGDIVTACSDGVTRIWTVQPEKVADPLELEAYASELSQYKISRYYCCGFKTLALLTVGILHLKSSDLRTFSFFCFFCVQC